MNQHHIRIAPRARRRAPALSLVEIVLQTLYP
jgi:hypothetical protein